MGALRLFWMGVCRECQNGALQDGPTKTKIKLGELSMTITGVYGTARSY